MASIERWNGRRWRAHWRSPGGRSQSKVFDRKIDAHKFLTSVQHSKHAGIYVEPSRQALGGFLDEWLAAIRHTIEPTTWSSYERIVEAKIKPRIGGIALQKLDPTRISRLYGELLASGRRNGGPLAPKSVLNVHICLHKALQDAVRWDRLARNPADRVDRPEVSEAEMQTWTAEQLYRFLEHVADDPLVAAWVVATSTGMRKGEVLGLRWSKVDLDARRISVTHQLTTVKSKPVYKTVKSKKSRRLVVLDAETAAVLRAHRVRQVEQRLAMGAGWQGEDFVITQPDGSLIHPDRFLAWFKRRCHGAGVPVIRLHDARHTHATLALAAGVHLKVVSERLGHSTTAITADIYSHVTPAMAADAAETVAQLVRAASTKSG